MCCVLRKKRILLRSGFFLVVGWMRTKTALVREIKEETGLDVALLHPCDVTMWGVNDDHRYAIFFLCRLKGDDNVQISHEHQEYKWFGFDELQEIAFHAPSFKEVLENARKMVEALNG